MKNLIILTLSLFVFYSCTQEHSNKYLTFSGKLENISKNDSLIQIVNNSGTILKTISLNDDGSFNDSLIVKNPAVYTFQLGQKRAPVFLKNGYDLDFKGDANDFMKSFVYSGIGSESNNFILAQILETQKLGNPMQIFALDSIEFKQRVTAIKDGFETIANSYENVDSTLISQTKQQLSQIISYLNTNYSQQHEIALLNLKAIESTKKGMPSPTFTNYENAKGGKKSLADFKGKFVYIDIWATWCGPCIREIPSLQSIEKEYSNKKIAFVSISTDEPRKSGGSWEAAQEKWKTFVKEREMSGIQLWAGKDLSFQQAYMINSIPRFILLDTKGNIVDANAPRPSDPRLKSLFTELGI